LTNEQNYSSQMTKVSCKITILVSYNVYHNVWELWVFIRELSIAAMLNPSLIKA